MDVDVEVGRDSVIAPGCALQGATRLGEVFCHDASTGTLPEDEAVAWAGEWLAIVAESMPVPQL